MCAIAIILTRDTKFVVAVDLGIILVFTELAAYAFLYFFKS